MPFSAEFLRRHTRDERVTGFGNRLALRRQMIVRDDGDIVIQLILVVPHLDDGDQRIWVLQHGFVDVTARYGNGFLDLPDDFRVLGFQRRRPFDIEEDPEGVMRESLNTDIEIILAGG